jgi:hypothetical protein
MILNIVENGVTEITEDQMETLFFSAQGKIALLSDINV